MIPDLPPSQETMEESLARLAEINDSATMDPKDMQNLKLFKIQSAKAEEGKENNNYSHEILDYPTGFDLAFDEREKNPFLHERKRLPSKSNARPLLSYIDMIKGALKTSADGKMKLVDIYRWIEEEYPFYKSCGLSWKVYNPIFDNSSTYIILACRIRYDMRYLYLKYSAG